jgi:hypothetical protein
VFFVFLLGFAFDPFWFRVLVGSGFGQSTAAGGRSASAWQTVRVLPADDPLFGVVSGGSVCFFGRSAVKVPDGPQCVRGQSAAAGRTVRVASADGSPLLAERSARACVLFFLVRFLPSSLVLPRVLQGIVPKTGG